ncbi:MAG TPA: hypothetical protein VIV11_02520 [Kofleriaceae bacterium]
MKSAFAILLLAVGLAGCADDEEAVLDEHQGVCNDLDETACKADDRCQQAYENSGHQPGPFATKCLLLEASPDTTEPCDSLAFDACRARNDCSLVYWQDLGPTDAPVGDPYYQSCVAEASL